jgi:hypothetical protein
MTFIPKIFFYIFNSKIEILRNLIYKEGSKRVN